MEKIPEVLPKGPELERFKALNGQRNIRTLSTHGLASRPQGLENIKPLYGTSKPKLKPQKHTAGNFFLPKFILLNSIYPPECRYPCTRESEYTH